MERNGRETDALSIFGIVLGVTAVIIGLGVGCCAIAVSWIR